MFASVDTKKTKSKYSLPIILNTLSLLVAGSSASIAFKIQGERYGFKHAAVQVFFVFFGEFLNIIALIVPLVFSKKARRDHFSELSEEARLEGKEFNFNQLLFGFTSGLDTINSTLQCLSMLLIPVSINQMVQTASILTSCIVSKIMLGRAFHRHHALGNGFVLIGLICVSFASMETHEASQSGSSGFSSILGIILCLVGKLFQAIQCNTQELILLKYIVHPGRAVGLEGTFGMLWCLLLVCILSFFACPDPSFCTIGAHFEDPIMAVKEILGDLNVLGWGLVLSFSVVFFNFNNMYLTKHVSCIFSIFWNTMTSGIIWFICIVIGLESFTLKSFLLQILGFSLLLVGNFTYNEMIEWKVFGLNKKMSKYIQVKMDEFEDSDISITK